MRWSGCYYYGYCQGLPARRNMWQDIGLCEEAGIFYVKETSIDTGEAYEITDFTTITWA